MRGGKSAFIPLKGIEDLGRGIRRSRHPDEMHMITHKTVHPYDVEESVV